MTLCMGCPAGLPLGSLQARPLGCRCRIEHQTLLEPESSPSLSAYCYGDYTACPTWQTEKQAIWSGESGAVAMLDERWEKSASWLQRVVASAQKRNFEAQQQGEIDDDLIRRRANRRRVNDNVSWVAGQG